MIVNEEDLDDFLAHYGVPGMKWGKRKARTPEQIASRNKKLKIAGATAVVVGAAATAYLLKQRGNTRAAMVVEAAQRAAQLAKDNPVRGVNGRTPSPFDMRMAAGMAAQRNVLNQIGNQKLTDKAWRDSANLANMSRR